MSVTALTRNGNAAPFQASNVMRLGDTTPKTLDIELNGRTLKGFLVSSRRFPSSTAGELDDSRNEYLDRRVAILPDGQRPSLSTYRAAKALLELYPDGGTEPPDEALLKERLATIREAVTETEATRFRVSQKDWEQYITRCLLALVPEMEASEADMLGPDRLRVLVRLGHLEPDVLPNDLLREMVDSGEIDAADVANLLPATPEAVDGDASKEAASSTRPPVEGELEDAPQPAKRARSTGARRERASPGTTK